MLPHSVTRSFTTCFTATWGEETSDQAHADATTRAGRESRVPGGHTHREPVGDAAACIDGAEAAAAQHGAHLIHLLEALLVCLDCGERTGGVGATGEPGPPTPVDAHTPGPRIPGCRIFTGR